MFAADIMKKLRKQINTLFISFSADIHLLHLFQPVFISLGIISYYLLPIIPTYKICLLLTCIPILFKILNQRLMSILSTYILIGFLAFHLRILFINYEPSILPAGEVTITATIKDIEYVFANTLDNNNQTLCSSSQNNNKTSSSYFILENIAMLETKTPNTKNQAAYISKYVFPEQMRGYIRSNETTCINESILHHQITCSVKFYPMPCKQTPNDYDAKFYNYFQKISAHCELIKIHDIHCDPTSLAMQQSKTSIITHAKHKISSYIANLQEAGLAQSLILGNRRNLSHTLQELFKKLGIYHILSISGLHLSVVAGIGFLIGKLLFLIITSLGKGIPIKYITILFEKYPNITLILPPNPNTYSKLTSILCISFYTILTGSSIPALRACIMYSLGILLFFTDFHTGLVHILSLSCSLILMAFPETLFSSSFQFSFTAMFAITLIKPYKHHINLFATYIINCTYLTPHTDKITKIHKIISYILQTIFTCIMISLYTTPLAIYHFQEITIQPILANLFCIPFITFIILPSLFSLLLVVLLSMITPTFLLVLCTWFIYIINQCINIEFNILLKIMHCLEHTSFKIHTPQISSYTLICFLLLIPFAHSRTKLSRIHLLLVPIMCLAMLLPISKPLMLLDKYGRIGYMKDNILYVSFKNDDKLALKWQQYYGAKDIRTFQHNSNVELFGYYIKPSNKLHLNNAHIITLEDCMKYGGLAIYDNKQIIGYNKQNKLHTNMIYVY